MFGLTSGLGIDLGTSNILVYAKGKGIVLREPSVVALAKDTGEVLAVGEEARQMLGRTPGNIVASRPLQDGVIANFTVTHKMLRYLMEKLGSKSRLVKPVVVICMPCGATSVERRAVLEAALAAGAKKAIPLEEPMAAAIGAGLPVGGASGSMVVDIGGGTTDIAVLALGGIVISESLRLGGDKMDEVIVRHLRKAYSLAIGERSAEEIKIAVGSVFPLQQEIGMEVRGRDLVGGLPKTVQVSSAEIREALAEPVLTIIERTKAVLEQTPPELAADIIERGITLTGGGALLRGFDRLMALHTEVPVAVADDPLSCVAVGTGKYLDAMRHLPRGRAVTEVRQA